MEQESFLLGDFNTDISSKKNSPLKKALTDFKNLFKFSQVITDFTRVTSNSSTTIDLIFVSDVERITQHGVIPNAISDHDMTFVTRKIHRSQNSKGKITKIRSMKGYSVNSFKEKLNNIDWFKVINAEDVDTAWCNFKDLFLGIINELAPVTQVKLKASSDNWFSGTILNLIRQRDKALMKFRQSKDPVLYDEYKTLRNKTQREIDRAKKDYVKSKISENKDNPKKLWQTLKDIGMPSKKSSGSSVIGLQDGEDIIFEKESVADKFNTFFCNISTKLVNNLRKREFDVENIEKYYRDKVNNDVFRFSVVSEDDVRKLLCQLNVSKSTGHDKIPARFLKDGANVIASPLAYIVNLSLSSGVVPADFKTARVIPLYKKGNKKFEGNYRPVSILPVVSKIFERIVYNQFYDFLSAHQILYGNQSGFRKDFSTDAALTDLADKIKYNMDEGLYTGMILIDLQKAFDTVDHKILLTKLKATGANETVVAWFTSYLSNRKQVVDVQGTMSSPQAITCGVPQGSILGPLLFLLYVNDMPSSVTCDLMLYADDSALIVAGRNVCEIEQRLSQEMISLSTWLESNKLSLHLGKTESILFATKRKLKRISKMNIVCNDVNIEGKESVKYLGATIDQSMSGKDMGLSVVSKVNKYIKFLYRKKDFLDYKCKRMLCLALIQPHFDYACNTWFRTLEKKIRNKLQCAQNKIIRYMLDYNSRKSLCFADFKKVRYLNVSKRIDYLCINSVFNVYHKRAPEYLCRSFQLVNHGHSTRHSHKCFIIPHVNSKGSSSFTFNGIKLWNSLPNYIKDIELKENFKQKCKKYLMKLMQKEEDDDFVV